ncbi:MAG: hypothetical protein Q8O74_03525 [bacterium]|nr:hypothetical protein [bacterium]
MQRMKSYSGGICQRTSANGGLPQTKPKVRLSAVAYAKAAGFPVENGKRVFCLLHLDFVIKTFRQPIIIPSKQRWAKVLFGAFSSKRKRRKRKNGESQYYAFIIDPLHIVHHFSY